MIKRFTTTLLAVAMATAAPGITKEPTNLERALAEIAPPEVVAEPEVVEIEVEPYPYKYTCESCTVQEQMALEAFQERGITDRLALAALMGNIRHESGFVPDICEGGARVPYEQCHRGGFGLIQWTTVNRYDGLGRFARQNECNPSTTECQLGYLFTEYQWKLVESKMKIPGQSIEWYMTHAYTWLGWGIHGHRTDYAYDYARMLEG